MKMHHCHPHITKCMQLLLFRNASDVLVPSAFKRNIKVKHLTQFEFEKECNHFYGAFFNAKIQPNFRVQQLQINSKVLVLDSSNLKINANYRQLCMYYEI